MNLTPEQIWVSREAKTKCAALVRRFLGALFLVAMCSLVFSCKKIEPAESVTANLAGELKLEPAKFADAIPDDYGPLVGVTQNPKDPGWVGLWFQKSDRTVTAVFVQINQGRIYEKTLTIPRK